MIIMINGSEISVHCFIAEEYVRELIPIHAHNSPRPPNNHTRAKITVVSPEHTMGKEEHQQLIRRDNGVI